MAISPTFLERLAAWGVADKATVVPNWAPIDELPVCDADNEWRSRTGLRGHPVVLYSGTLGLKHDPEHPGADRRAAAGVAPRRPGRGDLGGQGPRLARGLEARAGAAADNLVLLDFQPYEDLPAVMGSADVLVAVLEPDASRFSVPSKVLTYLCSGRAIVGVLPPDNSVAEILLTHGAGLVVDPTVVTTSLRRWPGSSTTRRAGGRWAGPAGATPSGRSAPRRRPIASSRSSATLVRPTVRTRPIDRMVPMAAGYRQTNSA